MLDTIVRARAALCQVPPSGSEGGRRRSGFALPLVRFAERPARPPAGCAEEHNSPPPDGPPGGGERAASAPLAALSGSALARKFCTWTGASGRRYICSVFAPEACPAFGEAVVIAVRNEAGATRRIVAIADSGTGRRAAGSNSLAMLAGRIPGEHGAGRSFADEVHVHLLCESGARRRAAIEDLARACGGAGVAAIYPAD